MWFVTILRDRRRVPQDTKAYGLCLVQLPETPGVPFGRLEHPLPSEESNWLHYWGQFNSRANALLAILDLVGTCTVLVEPDPERGRPSYRIAPPDAVSDPKRGLRMVACRTSYGQWVEADAQAHTLTRKEA